MLGDLVLKKEVCFMIIVNYYIEVNFIMFLFLDDGSKIIILFLVVIVVLIVFLVISVFIGEIVCCNVFVIVL